MKFVYVDESGDPGKFVGSNTKHYILSGIIVDVEDWARNLGELVLLRKSIKSEFNLSVREEIHAAELVRIKNMDSYRSIRKHDRVLMLKRIASEIPVIFRNSKIINIRIDKEKIPYPDEGDYSTIAWKRFIQRYDTYLKKEDAKGMVFADDGNETLIRNLVRKMRKYNPVPSRYSSNYKNVVTDNIIEDPILRDSKHSYFIQVADIITYALFQFLYPKGSLKKYGLNRIFLFLEPILLKEASSSNEFGIVER
ncbi:MAG: DUF3800 domain-containing protein [Spirochaetales bacterium]|nr:DUF3800 domain-containing protein [Spirochaetales bacterium]